MGLTGSVFYFCLLMSRVISLELSASDSNCADLTMSRQQQFMLPLHKGGGRGCPGRNIYQKEKPHWSPKGENDIYSWRVTDSHTNLPSASCSSSAVFPVAGWFVWRIWETWWLTCLGSPDPTTNFRSFSNFVGITIPSKAARRSNWIPQLSVADSSRHPGGGWLSWHGTFSKFSLLLGNPIVSPECS